MPTPWRMAAESSASSALALKVRPLGCTVTWKGPAAASALVMFGYPRSWFSLDATGILPSNQSPLGAHPARFRRQRILVVGCGDVGLRVAQELRGRVRLLALTSSPQRIEALRAGGLTPLAGDLDQPRTLARLAGLATRVVHLAPPASDRQPAWRDLRTPGPAACAAPAHAAGARWCMRRPPACTATAAATRCPNRGRSHRAPRARSAAPMRNWRCATSAAPRACAPPSCACRASMPPDREGGTPRERLLKGTPVLRPRGRRLHQPHPRRRPGPRHHRGALARAAAARGERGGRHRAEDGRLVRPGGRPLRPAAAAAHLAGRGAGPIAAGAH